MKRNQDQPNKNSSGKQDETNQVNRASHAGNQHVERDRNIKNDPGQKTGNERPSKKYSRNKQIRPLL